MERTPEIELEVTGEQLPAPVRVHASGRAESLLEEPRGVDVSPPSGGDHPLRAVPRFVEAETTQEGLVLSLGAEVFLGLVPGGRPGHQQNLLVHSPFFQVEGVIASGLLYI
ncbi:MAG: hypothetical protein COU33_03090 [Candidatus Magasanikbacteria bacterium CG10_big_fil_rev_8_21_14_0_10_43_6]|uniref:Uncharacterized protein n=1 Tax=Candidatus Magasanikbacteria bacterium CG10_big_fil_rev_8_21_14_0_10_43_6 TaxID=1974650 RepID=A0A2M6W0Y0_9BACT|nr:MAG: hypothetical protein COU33_03090 [Candidatus Magasanikbacteria bacterium CG10_big_fil_rev_8_21_14_0_10_43_6]